MCSQNGKFTESLCLFAHVRIKGKTADYEKVKTNTFNRFLSGLLYQFWPNRPMFRPNTDGHPARFPVFRILSFPMKVDTGERLQAIENKTLVLDSVLHPCFLEVFEDHCLK